MFPIKQMTSQATWLGIKLKKPHSNIAFHRAKLFIDEDSFEAEKDVPFKQNGRASGGISLR